ncbi:hypothetical protein GXW82_05280 [Streptacidiphilus sp. 4-A2]|nr:hypothetical protein [Streptacidiphilus sp. 4-A2]
MTAHCTPVLLSPSSRWICGTAMDTMVWSMKVMATAKIIAASTRFLGRPSGPAVALIQRLLGAVVGPVPAYHYVRPPGPRLPPARS